MVWGSNSLHALPPLLQASAAAAGPAGAGGATFGSDASLGIRAGIVTLVVLGVVNRVLYKLALVPMAPYVFFLAQALTCAYVAVYGPILWLRWR